LNFAKVEHPVLALNEVKARALHFAVLPLVYKFSFIQLEQFHHCLMGFGKRDRSYIGLQLKLTLFPLQ
jgi:hypothetical protein